MDVKITKILIGLLLLFIVSQPVQAAIYTAEDADRNIKSVYVAGNRDFYPVEYYNEKTKQYEGVMPRILDNISKRTGIDFTYLHDGNSSQLDYAKNLQVELVSAYIIDSEEAHISENVQVLSYLNNGKICHVGFAFTDIANEELIKTLKNEVAKISIPEINGHLISTSKVSQSPRTIFWSVLAVVCIIAIMLIIFMVIWIKRTNKKIWENGMIDSETGMGNIAYCEHCFNNMISDVSRSLYYIAYITIDSNYIQLCHGKAMFADTIKYTAGVLRSYSNENNFAARVTENEFVFAFQSTNHDDAQQIVKEIIDKLNFFIQEEEKDSKPALYAAIYKLNQKDRNCEHLLYNLRRNCNKLIDTDVQYMFYDKYMMNNAAKEDELMKSISQGFEKKEFKLYLQFVVDNKTKKIVSAEALSRWDSASKGIVSPNNYIAAMESLGFISKLDYYMFGLVCHQLDMWKDTQFGNITISCNFTRITLSDNNFIENIKEIASKYNFKKSQLVIEITEDSIEKNRENVMKNLTECKEMGFKVALDDMGNGYTSLINLCEYPIDIVKIDREIMLKADQKRGKDLFVGIIALAHSLGLVVVCEGVETEEHNDLVESTSCDYIQGWYYSRVFPVREAQEFAEKQFK